MHIPYCVRACFILGPNTRSIRNQNGRAGSRNGNSKFAPRQGSLTECKVLFWVIWIILGCLTRCCKMPLMLRCFEKHY